MSKHPKSDRRIPEASRPREFHSSTPQLPTKEVAAVMSPDKWAKVGEYARDKRDGKLVRFERLDGDGMPLHRSASGRNGIAHIDFLEPATKEQFEAAQKNARQAAPRHPDFNPFEMFGSPDLRRMFGGMEVETSEAPKQQAPADTVAWDDVKGQEEAKQALREAVELPRMFADLYRAYGKRVSKGVMLYGPPGCGKTMLGKALHSSLGGGADGFRYIKGGEFQTEMVGESEENIREAFKKAREYKARTGIPQILFFDEADVMLPIRTGVKDRHHSYDFMAANVATFLTEMDGMQDSGAFVILATNRPEVLDPAVLREGRIDRKIRVDRPGKEVIYDIATAGFAKTPKNGSEDFAKVLVDALWNPKRCHYRCETEDYGTIAVNYHHHQVSGAVADGVVERAINAALQRDIKAGNTTPTGVTALDVEEAVEAAFQSTKGLNLTWLVHEVLGDRMPTKIHALHGPSISCGERTPEVKITHKIEEDRGW